jgi:hypothetical protein
VRRQFVTPAARNTGARCGRLLPELEHIARQQIDLLLQAKNGLVEFFEQVFLETRLDFQAGCRRVFMPA